MDMGQRYAREQALLPMMLGGFLAHAFQDISDIKSAIEQSGVLNGEVNNEDIENVLTHLVSHWTVLEGMQYRIRIKINKTGDGEKSEIWFDLAQMSRPEY